MPAPDPHTPGPHAPDPPHSAGPVGLGWLADVDSGLSALLLACGLTPAELAGRLGCDTAGPSATASEDGVLELLGAWYRPGRTRDGLIRVGRSADWAFAVEYGDSSCRGGLAGASREGVEALRIELPSEDDASGEAADVCYARDGKVRWGYGLGAEARRYGPEPDLMVPDLVTAGVLTPDGRTWLPPADGLEPTALRRGLEVLERRFGFRLSPALVLDAALPAYPVRTGAASAR
ncbi:hypothetical protein ACFVGM_18445 [Kitasatospora purpeofusca]|uniref:hypothetical protein n=1 Tax=Kitasatospora purpeofusca TaxID=67352 RepID=UPI0036749773